ncbi:hypothetical protein VCHENC02_1866B, partial [Vibrio harveyi]
YPMVGFVWSTLNTTICATEQKLNLSSKETKLIRNKK